MSMNRNWTARRERQALKDLSQIEATPLLIDPLTHRGADGAVYCRDPDVERQIREALFLSHDQLLEQAAIPEGEAAHLKEECLVYLIRHFHRSEDRNLVNSLTSILLGRCGPRIDHYVGKLGGETARDAYRYVVERLLTPILDLHSDRGDFIQVRFWAALRLLAIKVFNQQLRQRKRVESDAPLSSLGSDDLEDDDATHVSHHQYGGAESMSSAVDVAIERNTLIQEALSRLQEPHRTAFLLRYFHGWPIEDRDPAVDTISRWFKKDPRTIRNWFRQVEEELERWRGEQA